MKYSKITYPDLNNGTGCRVTLWLTGCHHHCQECHNRELWNPDVGKELTVSKIKELIDIINLPYINGLTLSGGDPLFWPEVELIALCKKIKEECPNKNIWMYTGNTYETINPTLLKYIDVVVDGLYDKNLRDITLPFRGSSNQRIIYVKDNELVNESNVVE